MTPEEKIAFIKSKINETAEISPRGRFYIEFIPIVDTEITGGIPDEAPEIFSKREQLSVIKKLEQDGYIKNVQVAYKRQGAWVEKIEPAKTVLDFLKEMVRELQKQYKQYPAGKNIRYELYLGEDDSDDNNETAEYNLRLEALNQLKEEKIVLDYAIGEKYEDVELNEFAGTRVNYKIAKCRIDKNELQNHINALSKTERKSEKSDDYKQSLFLIKIYYTKILEILDTFTGGFMTFRDASINHYYTVLNSLADDILNKKEFAELKNDRPELFESLIGNIADVDVEWEFGSQNAYDFLGKIEKQYILTGSPVFKFPIEFETLLKNTNDAIAEHKRMKTAQWSQMMKNIDERKAKGEFSFDSLSSEDGKDTQKSTSKKQAKTSENFLNTKELKPQLTAGKLTAYSDGTIRYGNEIIKLRNQLKDLCRLFMGNQNRLLTTDDIKNELIRADRRTIIPFLTISKYVSELHNSLKIHFGQDVIFNQKEEGWYFKPPK